MARSLILIFCLSVMFLLTNADSFETGDLTISMKLDLLQKQFDQMVKIVTENEKVNREIAKENDELRKLVHLLETKNDDFENKIRILLEKCKVELNAENKISNERNVSHYYSNKIPLSKQANHRLSYITADPVKTKSNGDDKKTRNDKQNLQSVFRVNNFRNRRSENQTVNTGSTVAFHATVSETLTNIGDNHIIPFKNVYLDTNSAFHGDGGIFTCPQGGLYAFFCTILTDPGIRIEYSIKKNGHWFAAGYSKDDKQTGTFGTGTTHGIVQLETGDRVWVTVPHDGHEGSGDMIYRDYSSFMGFSISLE